MKVKHLEEKYEAKLEVPGGWAKQKTFRRGVGGIDIFQNNTIGLGYHYLTLLTGHQGYSKFIVISFHLCWNSTESSSRCSSKISNWTLRSSFSRSLRSYKVLTETKS